MKIRSWREKSSDLYDIVGSDQVQKSEIIFDGRPLALAGARNRAQASRMVPRPGTQGVVRLWFDDIAVIIVFVVVVPVVIVIIVVVVACRCCHLDPREQKTQVKKLFN